MKDEERERLLQEEERRMMKLRKFVDLVAWILACGNITYEDGVRIIHNAKKVVLSLFPGKDFQYDLIYYPRFMRILAERFETGGDSDSLN